MVSGCYDMLDIEDINALSAIFVDEESITYCTVSASPDEKDYNYALYTFDEDNIYQGINILSEKTGKKISLSHLEAIMFSVNCPNDKVKENINALLGKTNSHPKSLVAYYEGSGAELIRMLMEDADSGGGRYLRRFLDNRFSGIVPCRAVEFCYGVNFEGGGTVAPLISYENGNIINSGMVYTSVQGSVSIPRPYSDIVNGVINRSNYVSYGEKSDCEIRCTAYDVMYDKRNNRADISAEFEYSGFGKNLQSDILGKDIRDGMEYIVSLKDSGFDVLDLYTEIKKSFYTIPSFERYIASQGGALGCVQNVEVNIKTGVGGGMQ
jgi:hypothetical protein